MRLKNLAFLGMLMLIFVGAMPIYADVDVDVSVGVDFRDLEDYGEWTIVAGYGTVWRPYADPEWRPFTYGHWSYSGDGWLWVSDEPFGWIVCHYGNWYLDDEQGWVWIPGYDWSPARVEWHVTDDEIGWAPLFPPALPGHPRASVRAAWVFCPTPFFTSVEIRRHVVVHARPAPKVKVKVFSGPPRLEVVQRVVRTPVIRVTPNKVRVTTGNRSFIRVEVERKSPRHVEVPVGRKYKKVIVRHEEEPRTKVIVKDSRSHRPEIESETHRGQVESRPVEVKKKIHVKDGNRYEEEEDNDRDDDKEHRKKKIKIQINGN